MGESSGLQVESVQLWSSGMFRVEGLGFRF